MENYFNSVYQVLKAIEYSSYTEENIYYILDLEKLQLTENELKVIIRNILQDGFVINRPAFAGKKVASDRLLNPQLTTKGYEYLQDNTKMKQAYKVLKEIKGWIPGL